MTISRRRAAALGYDPERDRAPRLLAKGDGVVADRILEIARREEIPIHEDAGLVDMMARLDIDAEIPVELYKVVAEVIALVFRRHAATAVDPRAGDRGAPRDQGR